MPEPLAQTLPRMLEEFLAGTRRAVAVEQGLVLFDFATARYSVSAQHGKCLLHLWSEDANAVRRVLNAELKRDALILTVQRFGQPRPSKLEICATADRRSPSARRAARAAYEHVLERVLAREFLGWKLERLSASADLEHSFGPAHVRALLRRGTGAMAVVGVASGETQTTIDAAVATGMLWLDHCRQQLAERAYVEGLALIVPPGTSAQARQRLASLNRAAAKWRLFELDERDASLEELDCSDVGNIETRLVHCPDEDAARDRFAQSIARVRAVAPDTESIVLAGGEISFRIRGLEFARARMAPEERGFRLAEQLIFGIGAAQNVLNDESEPEFDALVRRLVEARRAGGEHTHPLYRVAPERWLESLLLRYVAALDSDLDPTHVYSQLPAIAASDRGVIDVLAATRTGRLAVIEIKAEENLHLPLQALDYWLRVRQHHERGEFQRLGYFRGRELSIQPPLLLLVAPALRIHPATEMLLRYFAPAIDWTFVAVDERWRKRENEPLRVVFRKHRARAVGV